MKKQFIKISFYGLSAAVLLFQSCKKNYVNPNAATSQQVFSSQQGLTGVAVGLQRVYTLGQASSLYNRVTINGLLTNEMTVLNQGNTNEYQLQFGSSPAVDATNTLSAGLWTSSNKIIYDANNVITGAQTLGDKNYASGLIGYASIFETLAIGDLAEFWEKVPSTTGSNVTFIDRTQGYAKAITIIDNALAAISSNAISTTFLSNIPAGIDIVNTLHALKARYSLASGNYSAALAEANLASLTIKSQFTFLPANLNPIYAFHTSTNNICGAIDLTTMGLPSGLQPDPNDLRLKFYDTAGIASKIKGFAPLTNPTNPWPVYLPGEMTLIKAEAYARQSTPDLVNALAELNKIQTKTPAADPYGVGANLPPYAALTQAQILDQIYKQRCIELYMSGLKIEDMRRFGRPNSERKRNLLPYPFVERDNNPNTPTDPPF